VESVATDPELVTKSWFFMSFNVMVRTNERPPRFLPNELGLVEYSLKEGIIRTYHEFPDPGPIPMGYSSQVNLHQKSHKIPNFNFSLSKGKSDRPQAFEKMFLDMIEMVKPSRLQQEVRGKRPLMVFAMPESRDQVKGCLLTMARETKNPKYLDIVRDDLEVLDIALLWYLIAQRKESSRLHAICLDDLSKSTFDHSPETNCPEFHDTEEYETKECAIGYAKRWCYMISDVALKLFDMKPTDKHLPKYEASIYGGASAFPNEDQNWGSRHSGHSFSRFPSREQTNPWADSERVPVVDPMDMRDPRFNANRLRGGLRQDQAPRLMGIGRGQKRPAP
jgi:protein maelstrom